ncbi:methyltransferase domain-containing protein [Streptomyces sp. NPDC035033]|uniref:methyltransferase domain-containing protein n=1 Tax=Streptomyces sp. NPDC035033 TaxID=3155368 RepID=UPI0033EDCF39
MRHDHEALSPATPAAPSPSGWPEDFPSRIAGDECPMCRNDYASDDIGWGILLRRGEVANAYLWRPGHVRGYCVLIHRGPPHVTEPTDLPEADAAAYWRDTLALGRALTAFYEPLKLNYSTLGNAVPHLHSHVLPRYREGDPAPGGPMPWRFLNQGRQDEQRLQADAAALRVLLEEATAEAREEPEDLFRATAPHYVLHRPGLPAEAALLLAGTVEEVERPVLLDLGTGTGQVPAALLPSVPRIGRVDLVDSSRGMLDEAARVLAPLLAGRDAGFHRVSAQDFVPPHDGYRADLVTCARAAHWMDLPKVLATADRVTTPAATVAIMGDGSLWTHEAPWTRELRALLQSFLGAERRAGASLHKEPDHPHEDALAESAFSEVTTYRFPVRRAWTPERVLGYLRSTSFAGAAQFAERHAEFEAEARQLLERHAAGAGLVEDAVFTVLLARRPGGSR